MHHLFIRVLAASIALTVAGAAVAGSIEAGDRLEMAAVLQSPITPTRAVQIAEAGGGRAFGYGMEANTHGHWYEVSVLRGSSKLLLKIDARSGKLIGSSAAHGDDAQGAYALADSTLKFGAAIAAAEHAGGGPALEADAAGHGATAHVDVDVIQDHGREIAHYRVSLEGGHLHSVKTGTDA